MSEAEKDANAGSGGTRRKLAVVGMLVAGLLVPALGIAVAWKSCGHGAVAGAVEVKGSTLGSWRTTIARCKSGGATFRGVELVGRGAVETLAARVEVDPIDGPKVTVWAADGTGAHVVTKKECPALTADVREAGKRDDDAPPRYSGSAGGSCPLPGGGTLTFDVWWRDCGE